MAKKFKFSFPDKLKSRKMWVALLVSVFTVLNEYLEWGISRETLNTVIMLAVGWIGIEGVLDTSRILKNGK